METFQINLEVNCVYQRNRCQRQRPRIHRTLFDLCDDWMKGKTFSGYEPALDLSVSAVHSTVSFLSTSAFCITNVSITSMTS